MKEYLLKTEDGKWIYSNTGESFSYVEKIEIPEGAERFTEGGFFRDKLTWFSRSLKEWRYSDSGWSGYDDVLWQREPKYKEFLNKNDNYNLVMLPEHAGDDERSGLIEVPDNMNYAYYTTQGIRFTSQDTSYFYGKCLWQRYTQPESLPFVDDEMQSINDQYAEIEKVRQANFGAKDNVNHPSHYTQGKVECIDALESATIGKSGIEAVCVANVIKYLWRYEEKNGVEDVKKAQFYLNRLLATLEDKNG